MVSYTMFSVCHYALNISRLSSFLADVEYDTGDSNEMRASKRKRHEPVLMPLSELCIKKALADERLAAYFILLPQKYLATILAATWDLHYGKRRFLLTFLLNAWRNETFRIEHLPRNRSWKIFYTEKINYSLRSNTGHKLTEVADLLCAIKFMVKMDIQPRVNELLVDLSRISLRESLLEFIINSIMQRVKKTCDNRRIVHKTDSNKVLVCSTNSVRKIVLKINCVLTSASSVHKLCKAVECGCMDGAAVKLVVAGIHFRPDTLNDQSFKSLSCLDNEAVEVVSFSYCKDPSIRTKMFELIKSFGNLRTLDLNGIGISMWDHESLLLLSDTLQKLPHLKQLHLSRCRITGFLKLLISKIHCKPLKQAADSSGEVEEFRSGQLEHLALCGCSLAVSDFQYLSESHHAKTLKNLDISQNKLEIESLEILFRACKELVVLEMENCILQGGNRYTERIYPILSHLKKVRFLDVFNSCRVTALRALPNSRYFAQMSNLSVLRISPHHKDDHWIFFNMLRAGDDNFVIFPVRSITKQLEDAIKGNPEHPRDKLEVYAC